MDVNTTYKSPFINTPPKKILTILSHGRNDSYMGNYLWRLSTTINRNAKSIFSLNAQKDVEIFLCDWGSEESLVEALTLTEEAKKLMRIIRVPPALSQKYNADSSYAGVYPMNAVARRAYGKYLLLCDSDAYVPIETMRKLIDSVQRGSVEGALLSNTFFWASRYHIPKSFHSAGPSIEEIDNYIAQNWQTFAHDKISKQPFWGAAASILMTREMWHECRGLDERMIYWGWTDIDIHYRLNSKYAFGDLEDFGMPFFHLEHYDSRNKPLEKEMPQKMNPMIYPTTFIPNGENWGLANEELETIKLAETLQRDYSVNSDIELPNPSLDQSIMINTEIINYKKPELIHFLRFEAGSSSPEYFMCSKSGGLELQQVPEEYAELLLWLKSKNFKHFLELGIGKGGSFLLNTLFQPTLESSYAVDNCAYWKNDQLKSVEEKISFLQSTSHAEIIFFNVSTDDFFLHNDKVFGCIFIDADHSYESVSKDFSNALKYLHPDGYIIFHDVNSVFCPGLVRFWNEIKNETCTEFIHSSKCGIAIYKSSGKQYSFIKKLPHETNRNQQDIQHLQACEIIIEELNEMVASGKFQETILSLKKKIEHYPDNPYLYNLLAVTVYQSGNVDEAENIFQDMIQRWPEFVHSFDNLGLLYLSRGQTVKALEYFKNASIIDPQYIPALMNWGEVLFMSKYVREAEELCHQALAINPQEMRALKLLGQMYLDTGRHTDGIKVLQSVLQYCPSDVEALFALGNLYQKTGDTDSAQFYYHQVLKHDPQHQAAREAINTIVQRKR